MTNVKYEVNKNYVTHKDYVINEFFTYCFTLEVSMVKTMGRALAVGALAIAVAIPASFGLAQAGNDVPGGVTVTLTDQRGNETEVARSGLAQAKASASAAPMVRKLNLLRTEGEHLELDDAYAVLTDPIALKDPFAVAGVTWNQGGDLPDGSAVEMRTLDGDQWSDWYEVDAESQFESERPGTEYYVSGNSTAIQVRISRGNGSLPAGLRVEIAYDPDGKTVEADPDAVPEVEPEPGTETDESVNPEPSEAAQPSGQATVFSPASALSSIQTGSAPLAANKAQGNQPQIAKAGLGQVLPVARVRASAIGNGGIQPRSAWGADEKKMAWPREYAKFEGVIVHHTAGPDTYTQAEVPRVIQGIYRYHAETREWGDIGYNVVVDKYGGKWEGRSGTLASDDDKMVVGGHARPRNTGTMGVSVLGTFTGTHTPSQTILNAVGDVAGWRFAIAGINPRGVTNMTIPDKNSSTKYRAGDKMPRIIGHRDVSTTQCPGLIYNKLDQVTNRAVQTYQRLSQNAPKVSPTPTQSAPQPVVPQPTAPNNGPVLPAIKNSPTFYFNNGWGPHGQIEMGYGTRQMDAYAGDFDGDGKDGVAVRSGNVFYIRNQLTNGSVPSSYAIAYGDPGDEVLVGDWNGDGVDTFAVRRGNQFYIKNDVHTGVADRVITYGNPGDEILVGDWDGNGTDTFAVRRGNRFFIRNSMSTGKANYEITYGDPGDVVYSGKFNPRTKADTFVVRRGNVYHVLYAMRSAKADLIRPYGEVTDTILIGDWDGDGNDTLAVRR